MEEIPAFIMAAPTMAKKQKQPQGSSVDEYTHYSPIKRDEIVPFICAISGESAGHYVKGSKIGTEIRVSHVLTHMWNLKKLTRYRQVAEN